MEKKHFVGIATHDEPTLENILSYIDQNNKTKNDLEFQFLLGVPREKIQQKIIEKGYNVRLYVPFATEKKYATAYAIRRFDENPHMAIYVLNNLWAKLWFKLVVVLGFLSLIIIVFQFLQ